MTPVNSEAIFTYIDSDGDTLLLLTQPGNPGALTVKLASAAFESTVYVALPPSNATALVRALTDWQAQVAPEPPSEMCCCQTCRYWGEMTGGNGVCLRFPPSLSPGGGSRWPQTRCNTWCGEWLPKGDAL